MTIKPRQERLALWQEGATDPLLLKDMTETAEAFKYSDADIAVGNEQISAPPSRGLE